MKIHSGYKVISTNRMGVTQETGGAYLEPLMVNMSHIIGKQVVKLLQAGKCSTHTIKGAHYRSFPSSE